MLIERESKNCNEGGEEREGWCGLGIKNGMKLPSAFKMHHKAIKKRKKMDTKKTCVTMNSDFMIKVWCSFQVQIWTLWKGLHHINTFFFYLFIQSLARNIVEEVKFLPKQFGLLFFGFDRIWRSNPQSYTIYIYIYILKVVHWVIFERCTINNYE